MKTITIHSNNNVSRTVACEDVNGEGKTTTIKDVCAYEAVCDFFDCDVEGIAESLIEVNGNEVSDGIRNIMLNSAVENDEDLVFDIDDDKEEATDAAQNEGAQTGAGICTVYLSGGLQTVNLDITVGQTTLNDVVHNDVVRARSGMSDAQLTSCTVFVNNEEVPAAAVAQRLVRDGDQITLSARPVHQKG